MTKKLTKAQLITLGAEIVAEGSLDQAHFISGEVFEVPMQTSQELLEQVVEAMPAETWVDPIKWVDETPSLDQAMTSLVTVKTMKKVKTVKTGVGAQILQLIAQGELSNKEIVARVLEDNPLRKTTYACVAWYKSQVTAGKIDLPQVEEETTEEETTEEETTEE